MRKSKYTEEQMVRIVREADKAPVADVAKKHKVSTETVYKWRRKFGGMDVDDARRLKVLEQENAKLKKLLAEKLLDIEVLGSVVARRLRACDVARVHRARLERGGIHTKRKGKWAQGCRRREAPCVSTR